MYNRHSLNLQLIGTPSEADLGFLNENAKRYIRQLPLYLRQSLQEKFPHVHPEAIDLVEKMLTFDPRKRITGKFQFFIACVSDSMVKDYQYERFMFSDSSTC